MSDSEALLAAIAADPDEDTPRLAYADWLDEHADELPDPGLARTRAEFIRVGCAVDRLDGPDPTEPPAAAGLRARHRTLIAQHRAELSGPLAGLEGVECWFRRGFVAQVRVGVGAFLRHAAAVAAVRPRPGVRVTGVGGRLADFLRAERLDLVTEVAVYPAYGPVQPEAPTENELRAGTDRLTRLAVLDLDGCGIGDWFCALLGNFALPALEVLSLARNAVTDGGVFDLVHGPHPPKLRRLLLSGNPIGDDGAEVLAGLWPAGAADRLEYLGLRDAGVGPTGAAALRARFGPRVEV